MNYLELICNIDNFAVGKWFGNNEMNEKGTATGVIPGRHDDRDESEDLP